MVSAITVDAQHLYIAKKDAPPTAKTPHSLKCPKCQGDMEEGYILDVQDMINNGQNSAAWVQGTLQRGFIQGIKVKLKRDMVADRCPNCGYVELYAP